MITGRGFACKLGIFASSLPSKWVQSRAAGALGNQHLRDIDRVSRPAGARCAGLHLGHRGQPVGRDLQELLRQAVRRGGWGGTTIPVVTDIAERGPAELGTATVRGGSAHFRQSRARPAAKPAKEGRLSGAVPAPRLGRLSAPQGGTARDSCAVSRAVWC